MDIITVADHMLSSNYNIAIISWGYQYFNLLIVFVKVKIKYCLHFEAQENFMNFWSKKKIFFQK